jgi:hypothetical protein
MTYSEHLSRNIYCLRSELLGPVISIHGAYKLLNQESLVAVTTKDILPKFSELCERLNAEISSLAEIIDLDSSTNAIKQLHFFANRLETDTKLLSELVKQVNEISFHPDDRDLDNILKKIISNGLSEFKNYIQSLDTATEKHLTQYDGFVEILKIDMLK